MADNIDEENVNSPTENQSGNPPVEITPTADTETITQNQETENMEVHHHAHHEGKKNWKSYFWEFLMLFLAITLGFFVENQREHYIEQQREKQFIKTLVEDIHNDTTGLNVAINKFSLINSHIDSLIRLLKDNNRMEKNAGIIYRHAVWLHDYYKLTYFDRTIEQLKSSGNFRLIRKKEVSRSIMEYDGAFRNNALDMQDNYVFKRKEYMLDLSNAVFKTSTIKGWFMKNLEKSDPELQDAPYFLTTEKSIIDRLINELNQYSLTLTWFIANLKEWVKPKAIQLDSIIKKEYQLD